VRLGEARPKAQLRLRLECPLLAHGDEIIFDKQGFSAEGDLLGGESWQGTAGQKAGEASSAAGQAPILSTD
jgi:hypothetical protein